MRDEEKSSTNRRASSKEPAGPSGNSKQGKKALVRPRRKVRRVASGAKKRRIRRPIRRRVKKGPTYQELQNDPLLERLKENFPEGVLGGQSFLNQSIYRIDPGSLYDLVLYLRDSPDWNFDYLVDITALDHLGDEKRFELVYHMYSYQTSRFIRLKTRIGVGETAPSVTSIWKAADWLEREVYDMFGIGFSGHPDLKRILLPEDWIGYPLRKDYDIKLQDQAWIQSHLRIRKTPA